MSREFAQVCICGRSFSDIAAFTKHNRDCRRGKKRLSDALTVAKEIYKSKRPRRLDGDEEATQSSSGSHGNGATLVRDPNDVDSGSFQQEAGQASAYDPYSIWDASRGQERPLTY
jgi:hypothetical protein